MIVLIRARFPLWNPSSAFWYPSIGGLTVLMDREEVLPGRNSSILRFRTSFLAGSPSLPPARKLVLILKLLLLLLGNMSCLVER